MQRAKTPCRYPGVRGHLGLGLRDQVRDCREIGAICSWSHTALSCRRARNQLSRAHTDTGKFSHSVLGTGREKA